MDDIINTDNTNGLSLIFYASAPCDMQLVGFDDDLYDKTPEEEEGI